MGIKGEIVLINKYGTIVENSELKFLTDQILMVAPSPDDWEPELKNQSNLVDTKKNDEVSYTKNFIAERSDNYELPITKFSETLMSMLNRKMKLEDKDINTVIQIVVDDIRHQYKCAHSVEFRKAAVKLISAYPYSFAIFNSNHEIISADSTSLVQKMINRHNYLNKSFGKFLTTDNKSSKSKNKQQVDQNLDLSDDDMRLYEEKRLWLKDNFNSITEAELVEKDFKDTFAYQRVYLNNLLETTSIDDIRENWPILLKPKYLKLHYSLLFNKNTDLRTTMLENIAKFNKILQRTNRIRSRKAISSEREFIEGVFEYFNELHHRIYTEYDVSNIETVQLLII